MTPIAIRRAEPGNASEVARLLHDFNTEFDDPTPGVAVLTERVGEMLEVAMETSREEGVAHFELTTSEADTAARSRYESAGFTNREGSEDGPKMLYYERDL